jgi:hypothetical protein
VIARQIVRQPFEFCISISLFLMGLQTLISHERLSDIVASRLGVAMLLIWEIGVLAGTVIIVMSFLLNARAQRRGEEAKARNRVLEITGLVLLIGAVLSYCVVVVVARGASGAFTVGVMLGVVTAACLRIWTLWRENVQTLVALRRIRVEQDRNGH